MICQKHGIAYKTITLKLNNENDVFLWMIDNQMARRNVSDFDRTVLALKKKEIIASRGNPGKRNDLSPNLAGGSRLDIRSQVAKLAGVSHGTVNKVEYIQDEAAPEVIAAVRAGKLKIDAAAKIATFPKEKQTAIVAASTEALKAVVRTMRGAKKHYAQVPDHITALTQETHGSSDAPAAVVSNNELIQLQEQYTKLLEKHLELQAALVKALAENESMASVIAGDGELTAALAKVRRHRDLEEGTTDMLDAVKGHDAQLIRENLVYDRTHAA